MVTFKNVTEYRSFTDGDLVGIKGTQGNFIFKHVARDLKTDEVRWVSVYGPVGKYAQWRSFTLDRLRPLTAKKRKVSTSKAHAEKVANNAAPKNEAKLIREWCATNKIEVNGMGRIPTEIRDRYRKEVGA